MKGRRIVAGMLALTLVPFLFAPCQTTVTQGTRSGTSRTNTRRTTTTGNTQYNNTTGTALNVDWLVMTILGNFLRHPNATMRKQAIQALVSNMTGGTGTTGTGTGTGVFGNWGSGSNTYNNNYNNNYNYNNSNNTNNQTTSPVLYVPDLYALLNDPDPEVADLASIGLDVIFGTDMTIRRFMSDSDPLIRRYATKLYLTRTVGGSGTTGGRTRTGTGTTVGAGMQDNSELVALRTILVMLKHEKDEEVRKVLTDALEYYVQGAGGTTTGGVFGSSVDILNYLNSENKDVKLKAIEIASSERSEAMLKRLMDMLAVETDPDIKRALDSAITSISSGLGSGGRPTAARPSSPPPSVEPLAPLAF